MRSLLRLLPVRQEVGSWFATQAILAVKTGIEKSNRRKSHAHNGFSCNGLQIRDPPEHEVFRATDSLAGSFLEKLTGCHRILNQGRKTALIPNMISMNTTA